MKIERINSNNIRRSYIFYNKGLCHYTNNPKYVSEIELNRFFKLPTSIHYLLDKSGLVSIHKFSQNHFRVKYSLLAKYKEGLLVDTFYQLQSYEVFNKKDYIEIVFYSYQHIPLGELMEIGFKLKIIKKNHIRIGSNYYDMLLYSNY